MGLVLALPELAVLGALGGNEVKVRAPLCHPSPLQHQNLIGICHGGQAVGDNNCRPSRCDPPEGLENVLERERRTENKGTGELAAAKRQNLSYSVLFLDLLVCFDINSSSKGQKSS